MDTVFYQLLTSRQITLVNMIHRRRGVCAAADPALWQKQQRRARQEDHRKASIAALIGCAFSATVLSHYMQQLAEPHGGILMIDAYLAVNAIQLVYNITVLIEIVGIFILKRRE